MTIMSTVRRSRRLGFARSSLLLFGLLLGLVLVPAPSTSFAHGHVEVGEYELVIGFAAEPAYLGEPNGLDLRVARKAGIAASVAAEPGATEEAHEHDASAEAAAAEGDATQPVEGLEESLQAELIFGVSQKTLAIEPVWNEPGSYTAAVIPTEAGDYTWRIFGTIEGTPVDVSMTSAPDTFASIEPKAAVAFPEAEPDVAEMSAQVNDLDAQLAAATATNQTALLVGGLGVLLAIAAMGVAIVGMRRRSS
jgi:hypothetical protein